MREFRLAPATTLLVALAVSTILAAAPAQTAGGYRLSLGDRIKVQIAGQDALLQEIVIFTEGQITYPGVGKLQLFGRTPAEIEAEIARLLEARKIIGAEVSVLVVEITPGVVYVQGAVQNPQQYPLPVHRELRLSQLIAVAGGLTSSADAKSVKLHRLEPQAAGGKRVISIDYERVASGADPAGDMVLVDGDSVVIGTRPMDTFSVTGEVVRPGEYTIPASGRTTLARAIIRAGGFADYGNAKKVSVHRDSPDGSTQTIQVDVNEILKEGNLSKDVPVFPGDLIFVPKRLF